MAQAGYTPIQIYLSTTASAVPSAGNLANGELAINITDGKLFYKDNGGVVQVLATKGAGTIGGSNTQVQYNNAGALAGSANLTFDGTTLTAAGIAGPHNGTVGATTPNTGAFTTLSASGAVTFSGGTANGVAYLNGSKVLTTGSSLTFDGTKFGVASGNIDVVSPNFTGAPLISGRFNASNFRMGIGIGDNNGFPFLGVNVNNAANDNGTFDINGYASRIRMDNGLTQFQVSSASGTAGGAITWNTQATLNATGALALQGGNTSATGTGITFPATQNASSDANTLDDYEEGTWTPSLSFGGGSTGLTYQAQNGRYTKIGNTVTVQCGLYLNQKGSSTGSAVIGGLPFIVPNQGFGSYGGTLLNSRANMGVGATGVPYAIANENTTQAYLYQVIGGAEVAITDTYFANSSYIQFAFTYRTNS